MEIIKITKTAVDKLPFSEKGQVFYRDKELTGFGLYVGKKSKTFYAEKRISRKTVRVTLGTFGQLSAEQARKMALEALAKMTAGTNPLDEKKSQAVKKVTLKQAFLDFKEARKGLKPKTLYDYERLIEVAFKNWHKKPMVEITKDMVERKHRKLGEERGEAYSNLSMRFLRALFNFSIGKYENSQGHALIQENPVRRLSQTRAWYKTKRRQTVIKEHELPAWYTAVLDLANKTLRDYLLFLLFTGLRRQEAATLKWEQVDLKSKTVTIVDTKNHKPLTLPLSGFLLDLLSKRSKTAINDFVFPGNGEAGHIIEPKQALKNVSSESGVSFTIHDLRRTFITVAESLDIPHYAVKRLVNHQMSGDVTAGYIVTNVDRLRSPMQKITDHFLKLAGVQENGKVIPLSMLKSG